MLEVCVDSFESAKAAFDGGNSLKTLKLNLFLIKFAIFTIFLGASRLELCSALSEGGLTPTLGMLKLIKKHVRISKFVFQLNS